MFYPFRDDFANLKLESYTANKSFAEDLTEGKYSFPILHCVRTNTRDDRVAKILRQRTCVERWSGWCRFRSFGHLRDDPEERCVLRAESVVVRLELVEGLGKGKFNMKMPTD